MNDSGQTLSGRTVLLGVTGGMACYKSAELVRGLRARGADVTVVMTESATRFVTPLTFGALSGNPVYTGLYDAGTDGRISHIELVRNSDAFVVAPATANIIGKMASGIADDLLSTMLVAARCPVMVAPAMNCRMYDSPAVRRNLETLRRDGIVVIGPEQGQMACGESGWGRMSEPADIAGAVVSALSRRGLLDGKKVLVTAGPTVEDIDPVRFISNRSTGKMGYRIAAAARDLGADVTLVSGPTALVPPSGVRFVSVRSAAEMKAAVDAHAGKADLVVMAAAVSDYVPKLRSASKLKKSSATLDIQLARTPDIVAGVAGNKKKGAVVVGFAAETEELEKNARKKLKEKGLDLIAANPVGADTGFGSEYNILSVFGPGGLLFETGRVTKAAAASMLLDCVIANTGILGLKKRPG